jgi:hypothetical protein
MTIEILWPCIILGHEVLKSRLYSLMKKGVTFLEISKDVNLLEAKLKKKIVLKPKVEHLAMNFRSLNFSSSHHKTLKPRIDFELGRNQWVLSR